MMTAESARHRPEESTEGRARRRSSAPGIGLVLLAAFSLALGGNPASAAVLHLTAPAAGEVAELEIGDDLRIEASGLGARRAVDILLLDDGGAELRRLEARTGADGSLPSTLLWFRTGVVGCDRIRFPDEILPLEFATFQGAEAALLGRTFSVLLKPPAGRQVISAKRFTFVPRRSARFFFADGEGCPRYRFETEEDIYLARYGGAEEVLRVFVIGARSRWRGSGQRFHESHGREEGALALPSAGGELLSQAGALPVGSYAAVLRFDLNDTRQVFVDGDVFLIPEEIEDEGPTNDDGLVINEWGSEGPFDPP